MSKKMMNVLIDEHESIIKRGMLAGLFDVELSSTHRNRSIQATQIKSRTLNISLQKYPR